jgi:aerobic-type carbon monoxide dehydrogenase small subunit (CoxS/CutS family)
MAEKIRLKVDGKVREARADPATPLLYVLRDDLGLNNPRFGCGLGQCGACTVHLDGKPARACVLPAAAVKGQAITTVRGLGTPERPHPLQTAYVEEQVPQCGVCTNGFLMTAAALLAANPDPSDAEIRQALAGLKCRCGTHMAIVRAVKRAAASMRAKA